MKKYEISFNNKRYKSKPSGAEIGKISNGLYTKSIDFRELAYEVGACGCTFSPAVYDGKRRKENFVGQQLIGLDFDNGVTFAEIKDRANHYRLPILFAYKTFSCTEKQEKFRVVFALSDMIYDFSTAETVTAIFMKIFSECDEACKDCSRMFFGGKGLLELANEPVEISYKDMIIAFVTYMNDRYGASHYTREIKKFYQNLDVKYDKILPVIDNGKFIYEGKSSSVSKNSADKNKGRRSVTRNFDWNILHKKCRLYRDFAEGNEYYYYPQLFHIATNLINIEKGKNEFLRVLKLSKNADYDAYHKRNWDVILNILIAMNYQPQGCCNCPHENECLHAKNMILTAKPGKSTILQITEKEYVTIQEAEEDLKNNFLKAVDSEKQGVHIIKAQTGIGKTNFYLNYLLHTDKTFLIAVPTHKLKMEVYNKAVFKGVKNIAFTPEMPDFSDEIQEKINHIYSVGAGKYARKMMLEMCEKIPKDSPDYTALSGYLSALGSIMDFDGHIITTHDRLLLQGKKSKLLENREVIIDEDIMRTMLSTHSIDNGDILWAVNSNLFSNQVVKKLKSIVKNTGYQRYNYRDNEEVELTDEIVAELENTDGNIIDLADSCYVYNDGKTTSFLKRKWLPCKKAIVMSATANAEIYSMLTHYDVHYYSCKMAEYRGKLKLYPKYTFSRHALLEQDGIIDYLKNKIGDDTVITFKAFEKLFDTEYHYGAVEGLNCMEGKNISVIGLPNVDELVYKLYGMAAGVNIDNFNMRSMRVEYNGYDFSINSFDNEKLRTIQLWTLESLLEQAVGRARLLRFDCTVKVFARFPIDQALIE
ncbi:MAG: hypothetical protein NC489_16205 [Ruminococcus flavefaciens]|nr:hypothetical protein [Ruminococcus flavefaciens]